MTGADFLIAFILHCSEGIITHFFPLSILFLYLIAEPENLYSQRLLSQPGEEAFRQRQFFSSISRSNSATPCVPLPPDRAHQKFIRRGIQGDSQTHDDLRLGPYLCLNLVLSNPNKIIGNLFIS